nr:peptide deformylase [uncultured Acidaminococcus sp.]
MEFKKQKQTFKDFLAEIIQHEVDHLQGIVI